jgi:tight adherence protein B
MLTPAILLLAVMIMAPLIVIADTRRKRLLRRVEAVAYAGDSLEAGGDLPRSIRIAEARNERLRELAYRLLRMPVDLPQAHVLPVPAVFALGAVAAVLSFWASQVMVPLAVAALSGLVSGFLMVRFIFGREYGHYSLQLVRQLPDTIEMVIGATRAGLPASEAFRAVAREMPGPTRFEFARIVNEMALGNTPADALKSVYRRTRVTEYAIFSVTLSVQTRSGGRLSETIQSLAETIRQRLTIAARAHALAAEAKLSARIIGVMPFVAGAAMSYVQPGYLDPLFHDPVGKHLLMIAVVTLILGIFTMSRLIRGVTGE